MSDLFTPTAEWRRLPDRYAVVRRLGALLYNVVTTIVVTLGVGLFVDWAWAAAAATGRPGGWCAPDAGCVPSATPSASRTC